MCGIVGVVRLDGAPVDTPALSRARDTLTHRGPDGSGLWRSADGSVGLAHRRLAILDLSELGRQPLANEDQTVWVTYNGEIYNFVELRIELSGLGHRFRSQTDTEVIVHAYEEWGDSCVQRFRGMFAFGLWDTRQRRLLLARDRLGIKPLYYYRDDDCVVFASELKAIEAMPGLSLTHDETALYDFLTYQYVPAPKTPYTRVRKLLPGHTLSLQDGRLQVQEYWDVEYGRGGVHESDVRPVLEDAVRCHLVSDVPLGSLLSGGLDSSCITALAQRYSADALTSFSIGFDDEEKDETVYARLVAGEIGTQHIEERVTLDAAAASLGKVSTMYDEPFADSSAIPTLAVCRIAREHVTVALSGDGGDEVFGGYSWYTRHQRRTRFSFVPTTIRQHLPHIMERSGLARLRGFPTLVDGLRPDLERHVVIMGGFTKGQKQAFVRPDVARRFRDYDDLWYFRKYWRDDLDLMSRLQYLDTKTYLPDDILTKVDRASMAVSLELRPPLLDHVLVEAVAALPARLRTPDGKLKHLLKRVVADLLPPEILARRKQGFSVPLSSWIERLASDASRPGELSPAQSWAALMLRQWESRSGSESLSK